MPKKKEGTGKESSKAASEEKAPEGAVKAPATETQAAGTKAAETGRKDFSRDAEKQRALESWVPKTPLGRKVKDSEITSLDDIFDKNMQILEPEIVDMLVPDLEEKMVELTKTAKVRRAGRQFGIRVSVLVGDKNAYLGLGTARDRERWPALRKATRNAKLSLIKARKGCGSWECVCGLGHTVPFKVTGKSSSIRVTLLPAPRGTGLVAGDNIKDVLRFVGIQDVWCKTSGNTGTTLNFVAAAVDALSKTAKMRLSDEVKRKMEKVSGAGD